MLVFAYGCHNEHLPIDSNKFPTFFRNSISNWKSASSYQVFLGLRCSVHAHILKSKTGEGPTRISRVGNLINHIRFSIFWGCPSLFTLKCTKWFQFQKLLPQMTNAILKFWWHYQISFKQTKLAHITNRSWVTIEVNVKSSNKMFKASSMIACHILWQATRYDMNKMPTAQHIIQLCGWSI